MSLWKFGKFEAEVDFTDADFLEKLDNAKNALDKELKSVPAVGKMSDVVRAQCKCFHTFFDVLFYDGASTEIFGGKHSLDLCIQAAESMSALEKAEKQRFDLSYEKYQVHSHGNRQQRRSYQKNQNRQYQKNYNKKYPRK